MLKVFERALRMICGPVSEAKDRHADIVNRVYKQRTRLAYKKILDAINQMVKES